MSFPSNTTSNSRRFEEDNYLHRLQRELLEMERQQRDEMHRLSRTTSSITFHSDANITQEGKSSDRSGACGGATHGGGSPKNDNPRSNTMPTAASSSISSSSSSLHAVWNGSYPSKSFESPLMLFPEQPSPPSQTRSTRHDDHDHGSNKNNHHHDHHHNDHSKSNTSSRGRHSPSPEQFFDERARGLTTTDDTSMSINLAEHHPDLEDEQQEGAVVDQSHRRVDFRVLKRDKMEPRETQGRSQPSERCSTTRGQRPQGVLTQHPSDEAPSPRSKARSAFPFQVDDSFHARVNDNDTNAFDPWQPTQKDTPLDKPLLSNPPRNPSSTPSVSSSNVRQSQEGNESYRNMQPTSSDHNQSTESSVPSTARGTIATTTSWRKPGQILRSHMIIQDEQSGGNSFQLSNDCPIQRYYQVADKVFDQFMRHPVDSREELMEAYLVGSRLIRFLSSVLPTHTGYLQRDTVQLRHRSQQQLITVMQYVDQIALLIDQQEHEMYIKTVLVRTDRDLVQSLSSESSELEEDEDNNTTMTTATTSKWFQLADLELEKEGAQRQENYDELDILVANNSSLENTMVSESAGVPLANLHTKPLSEPSTKAQWQISKESPRSLFPKPQSNVAPKSTAFTSISDTKVSSHSSPRDEWKPGTTNPSVTTSQSHSFFADEKDADSTSSSKSSRYNIELRHARSMNTDIQDEWTRRITDPHNNNNREFQPFSVDGQQQQQRGRSRRRQDDGSPWETWPPPRRGRGNNALKSEPWKMDESCETGDPGRSSDECFEDEFMSLSAANAQRARSITTPTSCGLPAVIQDFDPFSTHSNADQSKLRILQSNSSSSRSQRDAAAQGGDRRAFEPLGVSKIEQRFKASQRTSHAASSLTTQKSACDLEREDSPTSVLDSKQLDPNHLLVPLYRNLPLSSRRLNSTMQLRVEDRETALLRNHRDVDDDDEQGNIMGGDGLMLTTEVLSKTKRGGGRRALQPFKSCVRCLLE